MAKNDVTFSIGADPKPLESDLSEAEQMIQDFADESQEAINDGLNFDDAGEGAKGLSGKMGSLITKAGAFAAAIGLAVAAFKQGVDWAKKWYGLNEAITKGLEQQNKLLEVRDKRSGEFLKDVEKQPI